MNKILVMFRCKSTSSSCNKNQSSAYAVKIFPFTMEINFRTDIKCYAKYRFTVKVLQFILFPSMKEKPVYTVVLNMHVNFSVNNGVTVTSDF